MSNWCWAYIKHHLLHHNQLVVEEFNSERKKGGIRYHFTLEASRLKEYFEGLRLGTDCQFDSFRALIGNFAGVDAPTPPPSLKEATKNVELDHTFIYVVRSKNNKSPAGKATDPIPKQCCFFCFKFNLTTNEIEIRTKYERLKLTLEPVNEPWAIALLTVNSRVTRTITQCFLSSLEDSSETTRVAITKSSAYKAIVFLKNALHTLASISLKLNCDLQLTRRERSSAAAWQEIKDLLFCRFNELDVFMNYSSNPHPKATTSLSAVAVLIMLLSSQSMNFSSCE
jgi:hypothetical protein